MTSRCGISQPVKNTATVSQGIFPTWHRAAIYSGKIPASIHLHQYLHQFIKSICHMGASTASWPILIPVPHLWTASARNLGTCKHDVCICVISAIFILLLIRPREKVITLVASQTLPKNRQIGCLCGRVFMGLKGRKIPPGRREAVGGWQ